MNQEKTGQPKGVEEQIATMGTLMEHMDSKLDILVEGQDGLQAQITNVDSKLEEFREEVNYKFEVVFEEFEKVHKELDQKVDRSEFETRVGRLEKKVGVK